MTSADPR
jgi:hypothetical protein